MASSKANWGLRQESKASRDIWPEAHFWPLAAPAPSKQKNLVTSKWGETATQLGNPVVLFVKINPLNAFPGEWRRVLATCGGSARPVWPFIPHFSARGACDKIPKLEWSTASCKASWENLFRQLWIQPPTCRRPKERGGREWGLVRVSFRRLCSQWIPPQGEPHHPTQGYHSDCVPCI